jgi:hypothetical protein
MAVIAVMPHTLHSLAKEAERERDHVHLTPDEARGIADLWHADIEKVRYLESLLIRCARGAGHGPAVLTLPPLDEMQRKFLAALLLRADAFGPLEAGDPSA